ncbi:MAG TPA: alpha-glucuronidase family glycosyl hydrolase, partial [Gemmatimonadales bacterium]|nr:alpha-glucuronidase family glycosyl hydrolase [Gemmatimonadales bacterium]
MCSSARLTPSVSWFALCVAVLPRTLVAEDGYDLWLRYRLVADAARLAEYRATITQLVVAADGATLRAARDELVSGLRGLLGRDIPVARAASRDGALVVGTPANSPVVAALPLADALREAGPEGFVIRAMAIHGRRAIVIAANQDVGALYGVFQLLRLLQTERPLAGLDLMSAPRLRLRLLDHWDNLNGTLERGYAGASLWEWARLPDSINPRYTDYARANASVGINGVVLTNVNADARILTAAYLVKVAALARVFRPWGLKVYLTARFSAPIEIGGLATADPLDAGVRSWWAAKADEIYRAIPDFGGFLV